jgi:hypothetical protein
VTPEQAAEIYYAHDIDSVLRSHEEVQMLDENNPLLLEAYRALYKLALPAL